ncbi:hypothetical protein GJAV_G00161580 [Gymnothorax javanicus]|nr:hypothetical protein GJAV_G00161580 [Gymnothorax javanicus]
MTLPLQPSLSDIAAGSSSCRQLLSSRSWVYTGTANIKRITLSGRPSDPQGWLHSVLQGHRGSCEPL